MNGKQPLPPTVMFFGLTNLPATFQNFMNHIFANLIAKNVAIVYMDDILIFTKTKEEHQQVTQEVSKILYFMTITYFSSQRNISLRNQKLNTLTWISCTATTLTGH
jgi:hypothetical protein